MRTCLVDTGAFLALEDADADEHADTHAALDRLLADRVALVTTNFIFDETYTLLLTRLGRTAAVTWGREILGSRAIQILRIDARHEVRAWRIIVEYADKDFSYTHATSFAIAEQLAVGEALSLDRHFRQWGRLTVLP